MSDPNNPLIEALEPLTRRVRTDVTAVRRDGRGQSWTPDALTPARLAKHLNGGPARGVAFIKPGESTTRVAVLDFDSHQGEASWPEMSFVVTHVAEAIEAAGGVPILFRSTGGRGVHAYLLWDDPQDAYSVRTWLREILARCGFTDSAHKGGVRAGFVEVYPRQDSVPPGGYGNQATLPLAGKSELLEVDLGSGLLMVDEGGRDPAYLVDVWRVSAPVPVVEKPERERTARDAGVPDDELPAFFAALAAIPNSDDNEVDYDTWRNVGFSVHAATGGSHDGLQAFEEWSARSSKHVDGYAEEKIWNHADEARPGGITAGTVFHLAGKAGWSNPLHGVAVLADFPPIVPQVRLGDLGEALPPDEPERPNYVRDRMGRIEATVDNVVKALAAPTECGYRIAYDAFRDEICLAKPGTAEWVPLRDTDYTRLRVNLERLSFKTPSKDMTRDAVQMVGQANTFDSAQLWLDTVVPAWDGTARVDTFLRDCFGADDTPYTRAASRYLWTALAMRVMEPGCQADMALILQGGQGARKTSAVRALAPDPLYFAEVDLAKDDADIARQTKGCIAVELSELRGLHNRDQEATKAWVSRRIEKWIAKYMENATTYPRRFVIIGTTNRTDVLGDDTGNRRWLPLRVRWANVERIEAERGQLWAEARAMALGLVPGVARGVAWQEAERLARDEHGAFAIPDEWTPMLAAWLASTDSMAGEALDPSSTRQEGAGGAIEPAERGSVPFTLAEAMAGALGLGSAHVNPVNSKRVGAVLRGLGYEPRNTRIGGGQGNRWFREGALGLVKPVRRQKSE